MIDYKKMKEALEENEDEVECGWCNELFPKSECRKEKKLGYICPYCQQAIKSHGEPLVFIDELDETITIDDTGSDLLDFEYKNRLFIADGDYNYYIKLVDDEIDDQDSKDSKSYLFFDIYKIPSGQSFNPRSSKPAVAATVLFYGALDHSNWDMAWGEDMPDDEVGYRGRVFPTSVEYLGRVNNIFYFDYRNPNYDDADPINPADPAALNDAQTKAVLGMSNAGFSKLSKTLADYTIDFLEDCMIENSYYWADDFADEADDYFRDQRYAAGDAKCDAERERRLFGETLTPIDEITDKDLENYWDETLPWNKTKDYKDEPVKTKHFEKPSKYNK